MPWQLKSTTKVKKWAVAQILEILPPPLKKLESSSHLLAYETTQSYKNWQPPTLVPLSPSEMAHTLVCRVFL